MNGPNRAGLWLIIAAVLAFLMFVGFLSLHFAERASR